MPPLQTLATADLHMPAPEVAKESHILAPKAAAKIALVATFQAKMIAKELVRVC
jgi:hypothetical protein